MPKTVADKLPDLSRRKSLIRWSGYFTLCNVALIALINLTFLRHYVWPDTVIAQLSVPVIYVGQAALMAGAPWLLIVVPLTALLPRKRFIVSLCVGLSSTALSLLIVDALLFASNQFHLSPMVIQILDWQTWAFAGFYLLILLVAQSMFARWLWQTLSRRPPRKVGVLAGWFLLCCVFVGQGIYIWADAYYYVPVTSFSRYLPLSISMTAKRFLDRYGLVDLHQVRARELAHKLGKRSVGRLNYPLQPLQYSERWKPLNVVVILIDAMRADMLAVPTAPNLVEFAGESLVFTRHYSGGNSSRAGIFSLFYGLPGTYWAEFESSQRPPVLMEAFQRRDFQFGIFSSFELFTIDADRTSFASIDYVPAPWSDEGKMSVPRDEVITDQWLDWLDQRDPARPFFGFLYFGSVHSRSFPADYPYEFQASAGASAMEIDFARYRTAMHRVDQLVDEVLKDLRRRKLLESTVVMITSDHGQEFNENGLGFTGHGTNFSAYQIHVPLLLRWPGHAPRRITRRTSHLDIAPTLLVDLLGVENSPHDYSTGFSLFSDLEWEYLIAGSYNEIALIQPDRVTTSRGAYFEIRDADSYRLLEKPELRTELMQRALQETTRFLH